jgi:hypothetical protein
MRASTGSTSFATVATGVIRFAWHSPGDHGDGLLVEIDTATRWCEVADVLLWPAPFDPATAIARAARSHAVLAVVAERSSHWIIVTFSHETGPAVRAVRHREVTRAVDRLALLEVVVERYRGALAEHDPRC